MEMNELLMVGAALVVGVLFFVIAGKYMDSQTEQTSYSEVEDDAKRLASLVEKIADEPYDGTFETDFERCTIKVSGGIFTLSRDEYSYSESIPANVENTTLKDATHMCVVKNQGVVELLKSCPE